MNFKFFFKSIISDIINRFRLLFQGKYDFQQHVLDTYFSTRIGIAIIGVIFPLILWLFGELKLDIELQGSISAYYHTPLRDVFVGSLFAIGAFLYLYKGFSTTEDFILDAAGICAVGVALLPTSCPPRLKCDVFTAPFWHGASAILFFILIALICLAEAFGFLPRSTKLRFFTVMYIILGVAMIALPLSVWLFYRENDIFIFKLEYVAICVFSFYWILKSTEVYYSQLDRDKSKTKFL